MTDLAQVAVSTATVGSGLALVALGYTLVFSATGILNFAHGSLVVAAGYAAYALTRAGVPVGAAFALAVVATAVAGVVVELVAVRPLGRFHAATDVTWVLTTFAAGLVIVDLVRLGVDAAPHRLPPLVGSVLGWRVARAAGVAVTPADVLIVVAAVALAVGADVVQRRTRPGRALRAVAEDREAAALVGVDPAAVVRVTFALAGALAGVAAVLLAPRLFVRLENGLLLGVQALVAAVLGGLGSARGALVGGYLVALVPAVARTLTPSAGRFELVVVFTLFAAVLVVRPTGLFGRRPVEKV